MIYRPLLGAVGGLVMALGGLALVGPRHYVGVYLDTFSPDIAFGVQRFAPAIIGLGALLWAARGLPAGPVAATLCAVAAGVWLGVAATGVFHYATGVAGAGILLAALSEVVLALLFAVASRQMRPG